MTTDTEVKLTKHIQTAVNAIQKQIDKYCKQAYSLRTKAGQLETDADIIDDAIQGLEDQIKKLKGEL